MLTFYQDKKEKQAYFELHKVSNGRILTGKPLSKQALNTMLEFVKPDKEKIPRSEGILPTNVLYMNYSGGNRKLVWHTKAQKQMMHFTKMKGIKDGEAWQPALLWVAEDNHLSLFVLDSNRRPTDKSLLYPNRYPNVDSISGSLCVGSAPVEKVQRAQSIEAVMTMWHRIFWDSKFSHATDVAFWKKQIKTKEKYQIKAKPIKTLQTLIREL